MANEFRSLSAHSAEHFGDYRDYWWNDDFLAMVARRWSAEKVSSVLDVGCGIGHWTRALSRALPASVRFTGVDREPSWVQIATERAGNDPRFEFQVAAAEALPFPKASFDVVTCQCLLMHVAAPERVLAQMTRVVRPGGLVVVAEPTNVAPVLVDAIALAEDPDSTAVLLEMQARCVRGKASLGEGNDFIGESLPGLLHAAGLRDVNVRLNDRAWVMSPPYASPHERAQVEDTQDSACRERYIWDRATARRYYLAGGGTEEAFAARWDICVAHQRQVADSISAGAFNSAGGALFYLAWGRT
jgi:SAM-dependent methyltransferase